MNQVDRFEFVEKFYENELMFMSSQIIFHVFFSELIFVCYSDCRERLIFGNCY